MKNYGIALVLLVGFGSVQAARREYRPSSDRNFDYVIGKQELAIVLFYHEDRNLKRDSAIRNRIKELNQNFKDASSSVQYVAFVPVNTAKDRLNEVAQDYNVRQWPTFMLFKNGSPYQENGNVVARTGFLARAQIAKFIRDHFQDDIADIRERKRQEAAERRSSVNFGLYYGPYGYPYYPYPYGWYYPYYGGGFGFSVGF